MTILTNRALVLAKLEDVFRTDAVPTSTIKSVTGIDSTSDVDDSAETVTMTAHPFTTGELVQATVETGALPTGLSAATDYYLHKIDANTVSVHLTRAAALADTSRVDLTDAVGTFTFARIDSDAFQAIEPDFAPDITVLDREVVVPHLSQVAGTTGRKLGVMTFRTETKGNGVTTGLHAPRTGVLLRGCGFAQTRYGEAGNTEETILDDAPIPINAPTGDFTYTKTTGYAGTLPRVVVLVCTTQGGSGVAEFSVYSPPVGSQAEVLSTAVTMTDSAAFTLAESAQITPTITTSFEVGDTFVINLAPAGHSYEPVSTGFESLTIYMYFDGLLHRMTGGRGTFTTEGEAGAFGTFSWTFTGDFNAGEDVALPTSPNFESTVPHQIELSNVSVLGGKDFTAPASTGLTLETEFALCAQAFSFDIGNDVQARECINGPNSLEGALVTDRSGGFTFNPETVLEAEHPVWAILSDADRLFFGLRVGVSQGNVVAYQARYAQYTGVSYGDRNNTRNYDITGRLAAASDAGNDELRIVFC